MYLVDTNVWMELLLEQERAKEARHFLKQHEARQLAISDFSICSIGIILTRLNKNGLYLKFLSDNFQEPGVVVIRLKPDDLKDVILKAQKFKLDFDDAYQYVAAIKHDLIIVSFDKHFDRTDRGRKAPGEIV